MLYEKRGISLLEILLGTAIFTLIVALAGLSFISYQRTRELDSEAQALVSILRLTRERSISSEGGKGWGMRFEIDPMNEYILFRDDGGGYIGATEKIAYTTGNLIKIDSISIQGGGQEIIFDKLVGSTSYYGTGINNTAIVLKDDEGNVRNVSVTGAGKIDVE